MTPQSIGLACNFYRESNALPGLLENASGFFDDLLFMHCPPPGVTAADDESIAILEKWGVPWIEGSIEEGFGAVRTRLIRESTTEWVWISDADERFYPNAFALQCAGTEAYPEVEHPDLTVSLVGGYSAGHMLRKFMDDDEAMAIIVSRRHWFDFGWNKPCQNWMMIPDWQLRCVRNSEHIEYKSDVKMHEQIIDRRSGSMPEHRTWAAGFEQGLYIDHFHCHFKPMEKDQRAEDIAIYNTLDQGSTAEMWSNIENEKQKIRATL